MTVALSSSTGTAAYGQSITLVATVSGSGTPSGTVTFLDGATPPAPPRSMAPAARRSSSPT